MNITPIKMVQIHEAPFKNTCFRLAEWISPYSAIFTTSQGNRRVGFLLTNQILVATCQDEEITVKFEEFGEIKCTLFGCVPNTNLSFYHFDEKVEHHSFRARKRDLTYDTFLFGYIPFLEPYFYRFQPLDVNSSEMFKNFKKDNNLALTCDSVANALPIFDLTGKLFGFSLGNYNDESGVISMRDVYLALKK